MNPANQNSSQFQNNQVEISLSIDKLDTAKVVFLYRKNDLYDGIVESVTAALGSKNVCTVALPLNFNGTIANAESLISIFKEGTVHNPVIIRDETFFNVLNRSLSSDKTNETAIACEEIKNNSTVITELKKDKIKKNHEITEAIHKMAQIITHDAKAKAIAIILDSIENTDDRIIGASIHGCRLAEHGLAYTDRYGNREEVKTTPRDIERYVDIFSFFKKELSANGLSIPIYPAFAIMDSNVKAQSVLMTDDIGQLSINEATKCYSNVGKTVEGYGSDEIAVISDRHIIFAEDLSFANYFRGHGYEVFDMPAKANASYDDVSKLNFISGIDVVSNTSEQILFTVKSRFGEVEYEASADNEISLTKFLLPEGFRDDNIGHVINSETSIDSNLVYTTLTNSFISTVWSSEITEVDAKLKSFASALDQLGMLDRLKNDADFKEKFLERTRSFLNYQVSGEEILGKFLQHQAEDRSTLRSLSRIYLNDNSKDMLSLLADNQVFCERFIRYMENGVLHSHGGQFVEFLKKDRIFFDVLTKKENFAYEMGQAKKEQDEDRESFSFDPMHLVIEDSMDALGEFKKDTLNENKEVDVDELMRPVEKAILCLKKIHSLTIPGACAAGEKIEIQSFISEEKIDYPVNSSEKANSLYFSEIQCTTPQSSKDDKGIKIEELYGVLTDSFINKNSNLGIEDISKNLETLTNELESFGLSEKMEMDTEFIERLSILIKKSLLTQIENNKEVGLVSLNSMYIGKKSVVSILGKDEGMRVELAKVIIEKMKNGVTVLNFKDDELTLKSIVDNDNFDRISSFEAERVRQQQEAANADRQRVDELMSPMATIIENAYKTLVVVKEAFTRNRIGAAIHYLEAVSDQMKDSKEVFEGVYYDIKSTFEDTI